MPRSAPVRRVSPRRHLAPSSLAASALTAFVAFTALSPHLAAQQVMWRDNPISGKVVGLTYGTSGWNAAEAQAVAYGGHLVTIRSAAENQWLLDSFSAMWAQANGWGPWIGFNDVQVEGQWRWVSGDPVTFSYWIPGEPNNSGGAEDWAHYVDASSNWRWNDTLEHPPLRSLIEVQQRPARSWSWPTAYGTGARPVYGGTFDMDNDGDLDYASPDRDSGSVSIWRNNGQGVFSFVQSVGGCGAPYTTAAVDWDSDGDLDLILAEDLGRLLCISNTVGGWSLQPTLASVPSCPGVAVGDVNADGRVDVVTTSAGSDDRTRVFLRQADGSLAAPTMYGPFFDSAYFPTLVDLDLDGALDLIVAGGGVRLLRGSASGQFTDCGNLGTGNSGRAIGANVNGDARPEVLITRVDNDMLESWSPSGAGPLAAANYSLIQNLACGDEPRWVAAGDVDGDLDDDVAVASVNSDSVHIFRSTPAGLVQDHVLSGQDHALCTSVVDLNGDGKSDILTSTHFANAFSVHINQSVFDCNANGIDDPLDIASGFAADCNGNGRPDSCDLALYGSTFDVDNDGILDECEATVAAISPAIGAAFAPRVVTVTTRFVPDGAATLTLDSAALAAPVVLPMVVAGNSATVTLPALGAASVADIVASAAVSYIDAQGSLQVSFATPALYTWDVPQIVSSVPNNAPFDQSTGVTFVLRDHVATNGVGSATFGSSVPQAAYLFTVGGQTIVTTVAPAQPAPGPVSVLLRFGAEQTLAQRGFVYLGPGITSLSATEGWQAGGEALDVGLFGFAPGVPVEVRLGSGQQVASVVATPSGVPAASSLSLVTPFVPASGALDLEVVQYAGQPNEKRANSPGAWLSKPPAITSVSPASGFQGGGELVTLGLEGFPAGVATQVLLGTLGFTATNSGTLASSTVAVTTTLAPLPGTVDVRARQSVGTPTELDALAPGGFTFIGPSLTSVLPASGPREGGTVVLAQTSGFDASQPAQVRLGGTTLVGTVTGTGASQTVSFRTTLATASGPSDVTISQGVLIATLSGGFTFDAARVTNYCQAKLTSAGTLPVIGFSGSPSASTGDFAITLSNALPDKYCLYFSNSSSSNLPFNGGKLCVSSSGIQRGPTVLTNSSSFVSCPYPVTPALVGQNRYIQWWFRDPADPFTVGLSGGLRILGFYP